MNLTNSLDYQFFLMHKIYADKHSKHQLISNCIDCIDTKDKLILYKNYKYHDYEILYNIHNFAITIRNLAFDFEFELDCNGYYLSASTEHNRHLYIIDGESDRYVDTLIFFNTFMKKYYKKKSYINVHIPNDNYVMCKYDNGKFVTYCKKMKYKLFERTVIDAKKLKNVIVMIKIFIDIVNHAKKLMD